MLLKFFYSRYVLEPLSDGGKSRVERREGALLKIAWPNGNIGFADLLPWPSRGDQELIVHIEQIKKGMISSLLEQSIYFAKRDAVWRSENKSAYVGTKRSKNSFYINNLVKLRESDLAFRKQEGYSTLLLEMGNNVLTEETEVLNRILKQTDFLVRIQFATKINLQIFTQLFSSIDIKFRRKIEFVIEPFPFDFAQWTEASKLAKLAIDESLEKVIGSNQDLSKSFQVILLRPSRLDLSKGLQFCIKQNLKLVIASSVDHPVGIGHAIVSASELQYTYPHMVLDSICLHHHVYKTGPYQLKMHTQGPFIVGVDGKGVGFDNLLSLESWLPI